MSETEDNFQSLVTQIKNGSSEAIADLVEQHGEAIGRVVRRRLHQKMRSQFDTLDFVQIVWASFFSNLDKLSDFRNSRELEMFLARIAEHKVIDACRRRMMLQKNNVNRERSLNDRPSSFLGDIASDDPTPSHVINVRDEWERLLERLPERYRQMISLRAAGYKIQEIADELDVHERTVRRVFTNLAKGVSG